MASARRCSSLRSMTDQFIRELQWPRTKGAHQHPGEGPRQAPEGQLHGDTLLTWQRPVARADRAHTSSGHPHSWSSSGALPRERWLQTTGHLKCRQRRHLQTPTCALRDTSTHRLPRGEPQAACAHPPCCPPAATAVLMAQTGRLSAGIRSEAPITFKVPFLLSQ